jgi:hypothetical protein
MAEFVDESKAGNGLVMERTYRSMRDVGKGVPWWWISNKAASRIKEKTATYRYRHVIKSLGGRWSVKRSAWYIPDDRVNETLFDLLDREKAERLLIAYQPADEPLPSPINFEVERAPVIVPMTSRAPTAQPGTSARVYLSGHGYVLPETYERLTKERRERTERATKALFLQFTEQMARIEEYPALPAPGKTTVTISDPWA